MKQRRRDRPPHVLVMVHAVREDGEKRAYGLLLDRLQADGHELSVITWDRGKSVLDLEARGPVGDIEDVNRWRVPIWLAKTPLRPVARRLRHARMRSWWRRANHPTSVVVLGLIRPEMRHYLPPDAHVGVVLGWRPLEAPESLEVTLEVADAVLAYDEAAAAECRAVDPDADVLVVENLWSRLFWSLPLPASTDAPARAGVSPDVALVLGLGPLDWTGGAEQFVAAAGLVQQRSSAPVEFAWIGGHPSGPSFFPYRFDVERLGLADRFHWLGERDDFYEFVQRAAVVVVPSHQPFVVPHYPTVGLRPDEAPTLSTLLEVVDAPVVRFDLDAANTMTGGLGVGVTYPDTAALAAAIVTQVEQRPPTGVQRALAHLLGGEAA